MGRRGLAEPPERGDIGWISFDPHVGREQAKRRPALVLTRKAYNAASELAVVCPISSRAKGHRFEVLLGDDTETSGVVISDQLRCYDWRGRRFEFRERAPERILDEVLAKIAALLEL